MNKIKTKYDHFPYPLLCLICFIIAFCRLSLNYYVYGDDPFYVKYVNDSSFMEYLTIRYTTWSSRIFTESLIYIFTTLPLLCWKIFIALIFVALGLGLSYLVNAKSLFQKITVFLSVLAIPDVYLNNAGWLTTTTTYLSSACLCVLSLCAIRDIVDAKPISRTKLGAYILATLFAANNEQCCFILMTCYIATFLYVYFYQKRLSYIPLILLMCTFCDLLIFFMSPGNKLRFIEETQVWWPVFEQLKFPTKIFLGFRHFLDIFFFDYYILSLLFAMITLSLLSAYYIQHNKQYLWLWLSSCYVFLLMLFFKPEISNTFSQYMNLGLLYIYPLLLIGILIAALFIFFNNHLPFYFYTALLFIGISSLAIVGFSPTLYASHARIFICGIYTMLFVLLHFYVRYANKIPFVTLALWLFNIFWLTNCLQH